MLGEQLPACRELEGAGSRALCVLGHSAFGHVEAEFLRPEKAEE